MGKWIILGINKAYSSIIKTRALFFFLQKLVIFNTNFQAGPFRYTWLYNFGGDHFPIPPPKSYCRIRTCKFLPIADHAGGWDSSKKSVTVINHIKLHNFISEINSAINALDI